MKNVFLSIIVPVYNVEKYLSICIDSIINQGFDDYELILIDDGSIDKSGLICDEYAKKNPKIRVFHIKNGGLGNARNVGLKNAKGEYIAFIDSDDYIADNCLKNIVKKIKKYHRANLFLLNGYKLYENGNTSSIDTMIDEKCFNILKTKKEMFNNLYRMDKYPGSACTKIYKKEFLNKKRIAFDKEVLSEDLLFVFKCFVYSNNIKIINEKYYMYRQKRKDSISYKFSMDNFNGIELYIKSAKKILHEHENISINEKKCFYKFISYEYLILVLNYTNLSLSEKKEKNSFMNNNLNILRYSKDKRNIICYYIINIFGYDVTSKLLMLYKKIVLK